MLKQRFLLPVLLLIFLGVWVSAAAAQSRSEPTLPTELYEYADLTLPIYFGQPTLMLADNTPLVNPITNAGATLGRVLFYDKALSANDTIACASCHDQATGFSDSAQFSTGFEGELTGRHSMGLSNIRYYAPGNFFWDERAETLEAQVLMPIQDSVEMGMTLPDLEAKLATLSYYPELFEAAFGSPEISSPRIAKALAQFVRSMVSYQSKFDAGVLLDFSNFTEEENLGRLIFNGDRGGCSRCHGTLLQIVTRPHNSGLDITITDEGAGGGEFKVPSLRNIVLTAPYMHDGRFGSLATVVEFYNSGVRANPGLSPLLRVSGTDAPRRLNLTQPEKFALLAFLNTLTDEEFTNDVRLSDPFATSTPTAVSYTQGEQSMGENLAESPLIILTTTLLIATLLATHYRKSNSDNV